MRDVFSSYHPAVNMLYFILIIAYAMIFMHPVCLIISFICAFAYSVYLNGGKISKFNIIYMLPMLIFAAIINPLFNHQGATILNYFPDGNPLTLESIIYGISAALMLACVISWFSCYNKIMTSDKFVYLFGRVIPALSLVLSMVLRFVPRFSAQIKNIADAQKCVGRDASHGNILKRAKYGVKILSIMITWALENAIETSDSMRSRGYGLPKRSAFSIYKFTKRDLYALIFILFCAIYIIIGTFTGALYYNYFPNFKITWHSAYSFSLFFIYFIFGAMPIILNISENIKWKNIAAYSK